MSKSKPRFRKESRARASQLTSQHDFGFAGVAPLEFTGRFTAMNVRHDVAKHRFMVQLPEGEAVLDYVPGPSGRVDFVHTFVPTTLRGRGIAEALVKAALDWAQSQTLDVSASCSYVARYLERHPQRGRCLPAEGN